MSVLFFQEDLADSDHGVGDSVSLLGEEAHHAVVVNRVTVGESLSITDGSGLLVTGTVAALSARELVVTVTRVCHVPAPSPALWLVQALAKGDRAELAVQAATELGVSGIIPWAAGRSISRWNEDKTVAKKIDRWRSIAREAMKQSVQSWLPQVETLHRTGELAALARNSVMLVLEPTAHQTLSQTVEQNLQHIPRSADQKIVLVVGPEGGISPQEHDLLRDAGAHSVKLGSGILRTSTAGLAALAVLNAQLGRW